MTDRHAAYPTGLKDTPTRHRALRQRMEAPGIVVAPGAYDCITARAFASMADMLGWGGHLLAPDGIWLAMKGKRPDDELSGIPAGFEMRGMHELAVPGLPAERHLLVLGRV